MSNANKLVFPNSPPLMAIKGQVSVIFIDGQTIEGEFTSQDQFNIFLNVNNGPVMISRSQIRYIKGNTVEQIAEDDSQANFTSTESVLASPESGRLPRERFDTEEYPLQKASQAPIEDDEDGTIVLDSVQMEHMLQPTIEDDEDGTIVLGSDHHLLGDHEDDDGTIVLPSGASKFNWLADDEDGTVVLEPRQTPTSLEEDDLDMTAVQPDHLKESDADATMVIQDPKEAELAATLTCIGGPHSGDIFKLQSGINTIGRSSDNVLVLSKDKEISRRHAIILQESDKFVVQDQNSLNGTFVNDEQITGPRYLENGDEVLVGLSTLKYQED